VDLQTQAAEPSQIRAGRSFRVEVPVRWGDLDALNHVNNTVYFRYMEEARVQCIRASGMAVGAGQRNFVLANVSCDFLRPILWPATVLIDVQLHRVGRSSIEFDIEMSVKGEEGLCARARNVIVGVDANTARPSPWTQAELACLETVFPGTGV